MKKYELAKLCKVAILKEKKLGQDSQIRQEYEAMWDTWRTNVAGDPLRPITNPQWDTHDKIGLKLVNSVLTPEEIDHALKVFGDSVYRRTGDSLMAQFYRERDGYKIPNKFHVAFYNTKGWTPWKSEWMRGASKMLHRSEAFALDPNDREAYDDCREGMMTVHKCQQEWEARDEQENPST